MISSQDPELNYIHKDLFFPDDIHRVLGLDVDRSWVGEGGTIQPTVVLSPLLWFMSRFVIHVLRLEYII